MKTRIVINKDRTEAIVYIEGKTLTLYHSEGKVVDLVLWYIYPSIPKNVDVGQIQKAWESSMEDTNPMYKAA